MKDIKAIAAQEAEKLYPLTDVKEFNAHIEVLRIAYIDGFNKCLELLAGSDGDMQEFDSILNRICSNYDIPDSPWLESEISDIKNCIKEYTAIHTAKMLGDGWIYTVDGMPERLPEHLNGDNVYDKNASITVYVTDYSDEVYNAYWDFSNNCWRHTLDDEILNDVVAWIKKPQSPNK